ncbi:MAG: hypothetical protein F7C08_00250 [Desulfurococcales archaeon]|nr:hypothetical protein [Desulfurococcales archaeon]MCE4604959.1 hypothetical protein [Desulfurococcales archaeon]
MGEAKILVGSRGSVEEYVLQLIVEFNRGVNKVVLTAFNDNMCKLADIYASLKERLGDRVSIESGSTGTRRERGRRRLYLEITVIYKPV